ncbi:urease accessory protein UreD [Streptomyces sp. NPDC050529]|uniref:urease accessory protein UreD n=1 Tax=unclassified Streptomyces TaxID=2593676 RepID=UPI002DD8117D|nr:urease accessory protein UreD [Streptomyces sp. NBC_01022]WRZ80318.1 urease accessory protein UreD [Streptomyces sp. NBC_01022]
MSVRANARITAVRDGRGVTTLPVLEGDGPLALRRTRAALPGTARVTVVGAMSAPLGGDRLAVEVRAGQGARLTVDSAAATVALPGPEDVPAHYGIALNVEEGAELNWLPEQLISAHGSELLMTTTVELAPSARLMLREEQVLGRHGEATGTLLSRLTVRRCGRPLLDQQLAYGPGAPGGWDGPAVLGGHRAIGQLLVVDPVFDDKGPETRLLGSTAVLTRLQGPAVLVTALAADARDLRSVLDRTAAELAGHAIS